MFLDDSHTPTNCHVSLTVRAPMFGLAIRFPIPDLRSDQERGPWFKKSLQKEVLYLELEDLEVKTEFTGGSSPDQTKMELTFRELIGTCSATEATASVKFLLLRRSRFICAAGKFQEEPDQPATRFLRVSNNMDGDLAMSESVKFDWPRCAYPLPSPSPPPQPHPHPPDLLPYICSCVVPRLGLSPS